MNVRFLNVDCVTRFHRFETGRGLNPIARAADATAMNHGLPMRNRAGDIVAVVRIDDIDYDWANQWKWCRLSPHLPLPMRSINGPRAEKPRRIEKRLLHIEIAKRMGVWIPELFIDHRDGDLFNACRSNLRAVTRSENGLNQKRAKSGSSSSYRGVLHRQGLYVAQVTVNSRHHYLGSYPTEHLAAAVALAFRFLFAPTSQEPGHRVSELSYLTGTTPLEMQVFLRSTLRAHLYDRIPWDESEALCRWSADIA